MVTGLPYEEVLKETGLPQFLQSVSDPAAFQKRQDEMNSMFMGFLAKLGYGVMYSPSLKRYPGRRYIADVNIRHPLTKELGALGHHIVIDEHGIAFDPSTEAKQSYEICRLREIIWVGIAS